MKLYRATASDPNRPHASEEIFFWRYASVKVVVDILNGFYSLVGKSSTIAEYLWAKYSHKVVSKLSDHPVNKCNPVGSLIQSRGQVAKNLFREFVDSIQMHHCQFLKSQIAQQTTNIKVEAESIGYIYTDSILFKKGGGAVYYNEHRSASSCSLTTCNRNKSKAPCETSLA